MKSSLTVLALAVAGIAAAGCSEPKDRSYKTVGKEVYQTCEPCHGDDGGGKPELQAPGIAGLPSWYVENQLRKFKTGVRGYHAKDEAGFRMRPMGMSLLVDDQLVKVAEYVSHMPKVTPDRQLTDGNAEKGKALYQTCIACHGVDGNGNEALNSPPIHSTDDWYMLTQLKNFKGGVRGAHPKDASGATMAPMAMTLADEQAMKDVIAYVASLRKK